MKYKFFSFIILVFVVVLLHSACHPTQSVSGPTQYTLKTTVMPEGAGTINPAGGKYDAGAAITLVAEPASGYAVDHWSGDFTGTTTSATISVYMNKDINITAYFKPGYHLTVTVSPSGAGTVSLSPAGGAYGVGDKVYIKAEAAAGYVFDHWSADDAFIDQLRLNSFFIVMDSNKNAVAHFKEGYIPYGTGSTSSEAGETISAEEAQQAVQTMLDIESRGSTYIEGEPRPVLPNGVEIPKNGRAGTPKLVNVAGVPAWEVPVLISSGVRVGEIYVKQIRSKPNRVDFITFGQYSPTGLETEYRNYGDHW